MSVFDKHLQELKEDVEWDKFKNEESKEQRLEIAVNFLKDNGYDVWSPNSGPVPLMKKKEVYFDDNTYTGVTNTTHNVRTIENHYVTRDDEMANQYDNGRLELEVKNRLTNDIMRQLINTGLLQYKKETNMKNLTTHHKMYIRVVESR